MVSAVVVCESPPTKYRVFLKCSSRGIARLGSICEGRVNDGYENKTSMNGTNSLSVQNMLACLHGIYGLWIFKGQKGKASRPAIGVTHNRTRIHLNKYVSVQPAPRRTKSLTARASHLAKLRKVLPQTICSDGRNGYRDTSHIGEGHKGFKLVRQG